MGEGSFKSGISQSLAKTNFNKINLNFLQKENSEKVSFCRLPNTYIWDYTQNLPQSEQNVVYFWRVCLKGECKFKIFCFPRIC